MSTNNFVFRIILILLTIRLFSKRLYDPLPANKLYNFMSRLQDKQQMVNAGSMRYQDNAYTFREIMRSWPLSKRIFCREKLRNMFFMKFFDKLCNKYELLLKAYNIFLSALVLILFFVIYKVDFLQCSTLRFIRTSFSVSLWLALNLFLAGG